MNEPLVLVGIPFYKDCNTLDYAIQSVLKQTYKNWHMILLDDGGNDGSINVAKRYLNESRIELISDGKNKGLPIRLNELIELSHEKYFARMDADDIMHPMRLEKQVEYLESHPEIDVLGTEAYSLSIDNIVLGKKKSVVSKVTEHTLFQQAAFIHPTIMAKTKWMKHNRYCEESFAIRAEDFELWCRTYSNSRFANLDERLLYYREGNSIKKTLKNQMLTYDNTIQIIKKYAPQYLSKSEIKDLVRNIIRKKVIWKILEVSHTLSILSPYILKKRYMIMPEKDRYKEQMFLNDIINIR